MAQKSALLIGATGLVGSELLKLLLNASEYKSVTILVRRASGMVHPKLQEQVVDFNRLADYADLMVVDDVFCCMGTTIKKAGSKEVMYRIDVEYPLEVAKLSYEQGAKHYILVSSMNANPHSNIWYSKMKGELEQQLQQIPFASISIARPSLLLGERNERRVGEQLASVLFKALPFLFVGPFEKVRAIEGSQVAKALMFMARHARKGVRIFPSIELQDMERARLR